MFLHLSVICLRGEGACVCVAGACMAGGGVCGWRCMTRGMLDRGHAWRV